MKPEQTDAKRRTFLKTISIGFGGLAALVAGIPVVGALMAPLLQKHREVWRTVGSVSDFEVGATQLVKYENPDPLPWSGVTAHSAAWLRRDSAQSFLAFSVNCTHLGCPVRWEQQAELFMCPCHGGVYYHDGTVAAGPPPKQLPRYAVRVKNGQVQIKTSPIPITNITA